MLNRFRNRLVTSTLGVSRRNASSLKVYGFPLSQPCRAVYLLLKCNKVDYEDILVDALKGENRKPQFKKINPVGLLPYIEEREGEGDADFGLAESVAILQYLCDSRGLDKWYPTDLRVRAKVNFWLQWNAGETRSSTKDVLHYEIFPQLAAKDPTLIPKGQKKLTAAVHFIETHKGASTDLFLVGNEPTIADLQILAELDQVGPEAFNLFDFSKFPKVLEWKSNLASKLGAPYQEVFGKVRDIAAARKAAAAAK